RVIADGTATELKARVAEQRLDLTAPDLPAYRRIVDRVGGRAVHQDADHLVVGLATDGTAAHVRAVLDDVDPRGANVARLAIRTATLDDVFLALTGHTATAASTGTVATTEKENAGV